MPGRGTEAEKRRNKERRINFNLTGKYSGKGDYKALRKERARPWHEKENESCPGKWCGGRYYTHTEVQEWEAYQQRLWQRQEPHVHDQRVWKTRHQEVFNDPPEQGSDDEDLSCAWPSDHDQQVAVLDRLLGDVYHEAPDAPQGAEADKEPSRAPQKRALQRPGTLTPSVSPKRRPRQERSRPSPEQRDPAAASSGSGLVYAESNYPGVFARPPATPLSRASGASDNRSRCVVEILSNTIMSLARAAQQ